MTSRGRFRAPTNAQRRAAARRQRGRTARRRSIWPWVVLGIGLVGVVAVVSAVVFAVVFVSTSSGTGSGEVGKPAANATAGSATSGELSRLTAPDFHSLAISAANPNHVLFGSHSGVLESNDGGRTWTKTSLASANDDAMGLAISATDPSLVFAAGHDIFAKSTDAGRTWQRVKSNLASSDIHGFAMDAGNPQRLYANLVGAGLFRSDDGGATWTRGAVTATRDAMSLAASTNDTLYAVSMQAGVLRSVDGGQNFTTTGKLAAMANSVAATRDPKLVYAAAGPDLFASNDGGQTWTRRAVPIGGQVALAAANPADPNDVLIVIVQGGTTGHVFRSKDGGTTWRSD